LLDVYLFRPESSFTASSIVQGISDHYGVILAVEREENCCVPQIERLVPVYHRTDVLGLQTLIRDKFGKWASNGCCVEETWKNFKEMVSECIERFVPHKILRKTPETEYYNKEVKRLKIKVRKAYNRRKLGETTIQAVACSKKRNKKPAQDTFYRSELNNEGKCWPEFYKYVKRPKGYR